jgi:hypothetical protein
LHDPLDVNIAVPVRSCAAFGLHNHVHAGICGSRSASAAALLPPTRTYTDTEIRKALAESEVDAVLIIDVGDSGVVKEYAGTFFQEQYSGSSEASGTVTRNGNFSMSRSLEVLLGR